MKINQFKLFLLIGLSFMMTSGWSQMVDAEYWVQVTYLKAYKSACSDANIELELDDSDYDWTARFQCEEKYQDQPGFFNKEVTSCVYCDSPGDCVFAANPLISNHITDHGNVYVTCIAWENDLHIRDGGNRCDLSDDDDQVLWSEAKVIYYRQATFPSNQVYTEHTYNEYLRKKDQIGCPADVDTYLAYTWKVGTAWKYTGTQNALTPTCYEQQAAYIAGIIPSWSVFLTEGYEYYFSTCDDGTYDSFLRIYDSNGYTLLDQNDNSCNSQAKLNFKPSKSGYFYIELTSSVRQNVPEAGQLAYGIHQVSNQTCATAITLANNVPRTYNTACSTQDAPAQTCGGVNAHHDVWFKYTTSLEGELIIDNCIGNNYNSRISVYTGNCGSLNLIESSCNDYSCGDGKSASGFRFNSCKNTTYYISVGGINGARGSGTIYLTFLPKVNGPTIQCPGDISVDLPTGKCDMMVSYTAPVGIDDCPNVVTSQIEGLSSGALFPSGATTNAFRVRDSDGNTSSCSFNVYVLDNEHPVIRCNTISVGAANNQCNAIVSIPTPTATDNCGIANVKLLTQPPAENKFLVGSTNLLFEASDVNNNFSYCNTVIIVKDVSPPTITCPSNITTTTHPNTCYSVVGIAPPVIADNCNANLSLISGIEAGSEFPVGITTNIYKATDASGNSATCSMTITVQDKQKPSISCPPNVISEINSQISNCRKLITFPDANVSDNCSLLPVELSSSIPSGSDFFVGTQQVVFTATDHAGNTNTCSFSVTILDKGIPFINCPGNQVISCPSTVNYPFIAYYDQCGNAFLSQIEGPPSGSYFSSGITHTTFKVTDVSGNTNTCSFSIIVDDKIAPSITCPENVNSEINSQTSCSQLITFPNATASDNCSLLPVELNSSISSGSEFFVGTQEIIFTATDHAGNTNTCSFTVTVLDKGIPYITCPGNQVISCPSTVNYPFVSYFDYCSVATLSQIEGPSSGSYFSPGTTRATFKVTDASGNTNTCSFSIIVDDQVAPSITCPDDISIDATPGSNPCTAVVNYTTPAGTDNCNMPSVQRTKGFDSGTAFPEGTTELEFVVTDHSGLTSSCNFTVTVQNCNEAPVAKCFDHLTTVANTNCEYHLIAEDANNFSTDPDNDPLSFELNESGPFSLGTHNLQLIVADPAGLSSNCSFQLIVQDRTKPALITLEDIHFNGCSYTPNIPTTSDNCSGTIHASTTTSLPITYQGTTIVNWIFDDGNGNSILIPQNIIIVDVTNPVAPILEDISLLACQSIPDIPTTTDNCAGVIQGQTSTVFPMSTPGNHVIVWTFDDGNGNSISVNQNVNVVIPNVPGQYLDLDNCQMTPCPPGTYCPGGTTVPILCPAGSYSNVSGSIECASCPAGTFQGNEGQTSCLNCPPGKYSDVIGSIKCTSCPAGTYQGDAGQTSCSNCPPGKYSSQTGSVECASCPAGKYQNLEGQTSCVNCPPGKYSDYIGSINCLACPAQTYNPIEGADHCMNCPQGTYNPNTGAVICPDCILSLSCINPSPVNTDEGKCYATNVNFSAPTVSNNCPIVSLQHNAPSVFPLGSTVINWIVTDISGVTSTCNQTIVVNKWGDPQLPYAYTILTKDEVKLKENLVESGGVGVMTANKKISLEKNTKIIAANTFVKSSNIDIKSGSQVSTQIQGVVPASLAPAFIENKNPGNNNIKIADNSSPVTLNLNNYGDVEIGKNVTVTFTGQSKVYIKDLKLKEGSQLIFNHETDIIIDKSMEVGDGGKINLNSTAGIQFYVEGDVKVGKNSNINSNIHTLKKLKLEKSSESNKTYMTGQFIADKVEADEYAVWNWNSAYCKYEVEQQLFSNQEKNSAFLTTNISSRLKPEIQIYPNPTNDQFTVHGLEPLNDWTITVFNQQGRKLEQISQSGKTGTVDLGRDYDSGMYWIHIHAKDYKETIKVFKIR